ncbi:MAG: hypothetical protein WC661_21050 [Opitutaceae bacterium]
MVSTSTKLKSSPRVGAKQQAAGEDEERSLVRLNQLIAKAAPKATRETTAALNRFHRDIAAAIRRGR